MYQNDYPAYPSVETSANRPQIVSDIMESATNYAGNYDANQYHADVNQRACLFRRFPSEIFQHGSGNEGKSYSKTFNTRPLLTQDNVKIESEIWEGFVDHIEKSTFFVNLIDLNDEYQLPKYQVEFEIDELPEKHKEQIRVGSLVRWETGVKKDLRGGKRKYSELSLIELPPISHSEMKIALEEAKKLLNGIRQDESP